MYSKQCRDGVRYASLSRRPVCVFQKKSGYLRAVLYFMQYSSTRPFFITCFCCNTTPSVIFAVGFVWPCRVEQPSRCWAFSGSDHNSIFSGCFTVALKSGAYIIGGGRDGGILTRPWASCSVLLMLLLLLLPRRRGLLSLVAELMFFFFIYLSIYLFIYFAFVRSFVRTSVASL